jgi:hypothetical protein
LPPEEPEEDFVFGRFTWDGREFSLYYERSLGYMQFLLHHRRMFRLSTSLYRRSPNTPRPNQAMQLTASKLAIYASRFCRRGRSLRLMHIGLAAADLESR